ncbi:hypothetical protein FACS189487_04180 [Campylobacterota bacterium]|nr:hypothetical protein FACS189487_04180 [Campylobacterota bacterium]
MNNRFAVFHLVILILILFCGCANRGDPFWSGGENGKNAKTENAKTESAKTESAKESLLQ